jgi:diguanylate cyclase (GGDEF)-like protein
MARHDRLTSLPNRLRLGEHIRQLLSEPGPAGSPTVLRLDLERFKSVNDTLGHPVGDELLRAAAGRLQESVGRRDLVFRLDGAAFAIVQEAAVPAAETTMLAQRAIDSLAAPFQIDQHVIVIGVNVGIASAQDGLAGPEAVVKCADLALQSARADGPGSFHFFEAEMDTRVPDASRARTGSAPCRLGAAVRAVLSTIDEERVRCLRLRGAAAMAPSRARAGQPGRVHPVRRGGRPDSGNRRLGTAPRPAQTPPPRLRSSRSR